MKTFMNFIKKFLVKRGTSGEIRASRGVETLLKALLLPILDVLVKFLVLASIFYFQLRLVERLT